MNILQLCDSYDNISNLSEVLKTLNYKVVNKIKTENISIISYDAFIVTADFLEKNFEKWELFFDNLKMQKKPIIFVYSEHNDPKNISMEYLSNEYKIKFQFSDCSVLDTPNWNYSPALYSNCDETFSMMSESCKGVCCVRNTNQFFIMKKNNIIIMHDLKLNYYGRKQLDVSRLSNMIKYILQITEDEVKYSVDWLDKINILDDEKLRLELVEKENLINKLLTECAQLKELQKRNDSFKSILYTSGDNLVTVVKKILEEMMGITIDDIDLKKQDLYFKLGDKNILVEVKGVNHSFQRDNISQVKRHIKDYAEKNKIYGADVDKLCKGVLILNPYSLHNLNEKIEKEFYSREVIADAEYEKVCTLDTLTLLNYYSKWKNDSKSIDIKDVILNKNYNKPDFYDIINY